MGRAVVNNTLLESQREMRTGVSVINTNSFTFLLITLDVCGPEPLHSLTIMVDKDTETRTTPSLEGEERELLVERQSLDHSVLLCSAKT